MTVRRTLPSRERSLIGAWCFLDHFGPDMVDRSGGMKVAPHPHTGLQTVSWLFAGEIEHRDSGGHHAFVQPGEVNLMTAGRGISHSEVSTARTTELHGAQLWVALPDTHRDIEPGFAHHVPALLRHDGWRARVFVGSLLGETSPVPTYSPLVGAELTLAEGTEVELDLDPTFEYGVLADTGSVLVDGSELPQHAVGYLPPGASRMRLSGRGRSTRLLLLGGEPLGEEIVMWWNFVGRTHEEIVAFREEWQRQIHDGDDLVTTGHRVAPGRFGVVSERLGPIPAPTLPQARLKSRR
ncbi:MAG: pirin family protein [Nocardioidaceae bacterium]|nr:pirin family protein [Nocardioidaceae bacterium]